jgi:hypothetical protein
VTKRKAETHRYTADIINSGVEPWRMLCGAVLSRAVKDARGDVSEFPIYGPKERAESYAQRKADCTQDARRFLTNDAYVWCEYMPTPHVWHDLLDGLSL